jgi:DNA (cytosine-5)-methyltransferase 1
MQLRPSGIRAKAPTYLPALVAITQTSILGSRGRGLTSREAARLQGLPRSFRFVNMLEAASYKQVGNGVAAGAAAYVLRKHVEQNKDDLVEGLAAAILDSDPNPCPDALSPAAYAFEHRVLEGKTAETLDTAPIPCLDALSPAASAFERQIVEEEETEALAI